MRQLYIRRIGYLLVMLTNALQAMKGPMPIGNFALPISQQPSPLFSFGQNIVAKGDKIGYINPIFLSGHNNKRFFYNEFYFLYGINERLSIFGLLPAPVINKQDGVRISGFGDIILQLEYSVFGKQTNTSMTQATIIGSLYFPTGIMQTDETDIISAHAPFTGNGALSFFVGGTLSHTTIDWYSFASMGGVITTHAGHRGKIGNSFFYQGGVGHNLGRYSDKIMMLLLEVDGVRSTRDIICDDIDLDSGGNIVYLGPAFYYSNENTIFQAGFQIPVIQNLKGVQAKNSFLLSVSCAHKFNAY